MSDQSPKIFTSRRKFLKDVATTSGVAAVASVAPGLAMAEPGQPEPAGDKTEEGYRLTQHVAAYYKSLKG